MHSGLCSQSSRRLLYSGLCSQSLRRVLHSPVAHYSLAHRPQFLRRRDDDHHHGHDGAPHLQSGEPGAELAGTEHVQAGHDARNDHDQQQDGARAPHDGRDLGGAEHSGQLLEAGLRPVWKVGELLSVHLAPRVQWVVDLPQPCPHGLLVVLGGDGVRAERDEDGEEDGDEEARAAAGQYGVQMGGVQQELAQPAL